MKNLEQKFESYSGMRQEIFEKEEDTSARERIDRASREHSDRAGGGSHGRDFGDFWYQKQLF